LTGEVTIAVAPGFPCLAGLYIFAPSVGSRRLISIVRSLEKEFRA